MTTYRYAATDLLTGKVLADSLPTLTVQSASAQINGGGSLSGTLNLDGTRQASNLPWLEALRSRRCLLWILADDYPVWAGVVWDRPDMSRSQGTLPVAAQTIDSVLAKRQITASLDYPGTDIFTVFLDLVRYAVTKTSPYITTLSPFRGPASPLIASGAQVAGLIFPSGAAATAGIPWFASYLYSDLTQVSSAISDLVSSGNLEYYFEPGLDEDGNLCHFLRLSYQGLGRQPDEIGYSLTYPGNASDYGYQELGSQGANYIWATAQPNGAATAWLSQYPHGVNLADLEAGYPLMEDQAAWNGSVVTRQSQVDGFADGVAAMRAQGMTQPVITIPGGRLPSPRDVVLGDVAPLAATSPIHPPAPGSKAPGLQQLVRISGWTLTPPGPQQPESLQVTASGVLSPPAAVPHLGRNLTGRAPARLAELEADVRRLKSRTMWFDTGAPLALLPAVIDPAYTSGHPKAFLNGSAVLTGPYQYASSYTPVAGDPVLAAPMPVAAQQASGVTAYVIVSKII